MRRSLLASRRRARFTFMQTCGHYYGTTKKWWRFSTAAFALFIRRRIRFCLQKTPEHFVWTPLYVVDFEIDCNETLGKSRYFFRAERGRILFPFPAFCGRMSRGIDYVCTVSQLCILTAFPFAFPFLAIFLAILPFFIFFRANLAG